MREDNGIEDIYIGSDYGKKNKNNKYIVFIIISSIIIIAIIGAYFYMSNSSINVSKELFDKSFSSSNIIKLSDTEFYRDVYQKLLTQNSNIDTVVNFQTGNSNTDSRKLDLTKLGLNLTTKTQVNNKMTSTDIVVNYSNNELFKMNLLTEKNAFGISQEDVVNKYISTGYDTAKETMGLNISKKKMKKLLNIEAIDMTKQEKETYIKDLYKNLMENISEDKFETSSNVVLNNNGESIPVTAYSLKLSQEEFKDYLISILTYIRNDEELLDKILRDTSNRTVEAFSSSEEESEPEKITNIDSIVVDEDESSNINVVVNRLQVEGGTDVIDRSISRRSTENMFNVDGDEEANDTHQSDNRIQINDDTSNREEEHSNQERETNTENQNNIVTQVQETNTNQTSNTTTNTTSNTTVLEPVSGNNFSDLSANVKNFNSSITLDDIMTNNITSSQIDDAERSAQELNVTDFEEEDNTIFNNILKGSGIDKLQLVDFMDDDIFKDERFINIFKLIMGVKIDCKKEDAQKLIDDYIKEVREFKGSGLVVTVYVSKEKTEKISFEMPNSNKLDIEFIKLSDDENDIKFTYLYSGTNSQLFNVQDSVSYSAEERIGSNAEESEKLNGFSIEISKFAKDANNNIKVSYQKIRKEEVRQKFIISMKSIGNSDANEIKNNINILISAKDKPEEQYTIENTLSFLVSPSIEGFTDDNSVFLDELTQNDYDRLMLILQDKINQVKRKKAQSISIFTSSTDNNIFNKNEFIANNLSRDEARDMVISKLRRMISQAESEGREFTLSNINDLEIDGYNVSKNITSDKAIIILDVYTFSVDKDLNISDVD